MEPIIGYISIWQGFVCVLPCMPVRGQVEWVSTRPNTQTRVGKFTVHFWTA